jgi:hypothetical protein
MTPEKGCAPGCNGPSANSFRYLFNSCLRPCCLGWRLISLTFGSSVAFAAYHYRRRVIHLRRRCVKRATQWAGIIAKTLIFFNAFMKALSQIHIDHAFSAVG